MSEIILKISDKGSIYVEETINGVNSFKIITPDSLLSCINQSLLRGTVSSGLLPKNCISFTCKDTGERYVCILHSESKADVGYFGSEYKDFPLPRLVFGFNISKEDRISECKLGVVANVSNIKPTTPMFLYPFSNVSGFRLCTGSNTFPAVKELHTLNSLCYYILSMPNNNDYFKPANNKQSLEMRELLELLKDKPSEYYYSNILVPSGLTIQDFINERRS